MPGGTTNKKREHVGGQGGKTKQKRSVWNHPLFVAQGNNAKVQELFIADLYLLNEICCLFCTVHLHSPMYAFFPKALTFSLSLMSCTCFVYMICKGQNKYTSQTATMVLQWYFH